MWYLQRRPAPGFAYDCGNGRDGYFRLLLFQLPGYTWYRADWSNEKTAEHNYGTRGDALIVISKDFTFEASHILPKHPGKCSRLHGHSWGLTVSVIGPVDIETGFVCDYAELKRVVNESVIEKLDHTHLGQDFVDSRHSHVMGQCPFGASFYPSSENLVVAIAQILEPLIPELKPNVRLFEITLKETCTSAARYRLYNPTPSGY